jgi:hypothetical protein
MSVALTVPVDRVLCAGLVKFAVVFLVPYRTRINRIASYYRRDGRIISIYDSVTLAVIVTLVALLFLTDMHAISFITGLIAGMLRIQIFLSPLRQTLPPEHAPPESPPPPSKLMSYAIHADSGLAWREISPMTAPFVWALYQPSTSSSTRAGRDGGPDQRTNETPLTVSGVCAAARCAGVRVDDTGRQRLSVGRTPRARSPTLLRCGQPAPSEL